jgi:hypothetical protein
MIDIETREVEALLGEKDIIIYKLSKQNDKMVSLIGNLVEKLREKGITATVDMKGVTYSKVKK